MMRKTVVQVPMAVLRGSLPGRYFFRPASLATPTMTYRQQAKLSVSAAAAFKSSSRRKKEETSRHFGPDSPNKDKTTKTAEDAFTMIDVNKDGHLCREEVIRAIKVMQERGWTDVTCETSEAERMMAEVDLDGDGKIDRHEFILMVRKQEQMLRDGANMADVSELGQLRKRRTPTLEVARSMPLSCKEMDNTSLISLAALDVVEARAEVLRRHIMDVDSLSYEEAHEKYEEIKAFNRQGLFLHTLPYKFGVGTAVIAAFASIPLVFHLPTVDYFNEHFVTADIPEEKDLETWLEVGAWSWNWMEPPLGQVSFAILCLQFARNRLDNIGIKPYTTIIKQKRARRLCEAYPRYDADILEAYSKSVSYYSGG